MIINDVIWTSEVNMILIKCECGKEFYHPLNIGLIECSCGNKEWYIEEYKAWNSQFKIAKWNI